VHVENVVDGMLRAATSDFARGQVYNLANDFDVTATDFFQLGAKGLGVRLRTVHIPYSFARRTERALRRIARMIPGSGVHAVSFSAVDFLGRNNPFSSQRARDELGWNPTMRPEAGVPDAFAWTVEHARQ
jgi:hypothetical protein